MKIYKDEMLGKVLKWEDGKRGTWTIEELLGEDGVTEFKARLAGYKVERIIAKK